MIFTPAVKYFVLATVYLSDGSSYKAVDPTFKDLTDEQCAHVVSDFHNYDPQIWVRPGKQGRSVTAVHLICRQDRSA